MWIVCYSNVGLFITVVHTFQLLDNAMVREAFSDQVHGEGTKAAPPSCTI